MGSWNSTPWREAPSVRASEGDGAHYLRSLAEPLSAAELMGGAPSPLPPGGGRPVVLVGAAGSLGFGIAGVLERAGFSPVECPIDHQAVTDAVHREHARALVCAFRADDRELLDLVCKVGLMARPPAVLGVVAPDDALAAALLLAAGAIACVSSTEIEHELAAAVELASRGGAWVSPFLLAALLQGNIRHDERVEHESLDSLTAREREVLALMAEGLTKSAIAGRLELSVNTVRTHVQSIMRKFSVHSSTGAVSRGLTVALTPAGIVEHNSRRGAIERLFGSFPLASPGNGPRAGGAAPSPHPIGG